MRTICEREGGFTPHFHQPAVANANALIGLVAAGKGLAFFPVTMMDGVPINPHLVSHPLRPAKIRFVLDAIWNPANPSRILSSYLSLLPDQRGLEKWRSESRVSISLSPNIRHEAGPTGPEWPKQRSTRNVAWTVKPVLERSRAIPRPRNGSTQFRGTMIWATEERQRIGRISCFHGGRTFEWIRLEGPPDQPKSQTSLGVKG